MPIQPFRPFPRLTALLQGLPITQLQALADSHGISVSRMGRENESLLATKIATFLAHPGRFEQFAAYDEPSETWLRSFLHQVAPDEFPPLDGSPKVLGEPPRRLLATGQVILRPAGGGPAVPLEIALRLAVRWGRGVSLLRWLGQSREAMLRMCARDLRHRFHAPVDATAAPLVLAAELYDALAQHRAAMHDALTARENEMLAWVARMGGSVSTADMQSLFPGDAPLDAQPLASRDPLSAIEAGWGKHRHFPEGFYRLTGWYLLLPAGESYAPWSRVAACPALWPTRLPKAPPVAPPSASTPASAMPHPSWSRLAWGDATAFQFKRLLIAGACGQLVAGRNGQPGRIAVRKTALLMGLDESLLMRLSQLATEMRLWEPEPEGARLRLSPGDEGRALFEMPETAASARLRERAVQRALNAIDTPLLFQMAALAAERKPDTGWVGMAEHKAAVQTQSKDADAHPDRRRPPTRSDIEAPLWGLALTGRMEVAFSSAGLEAFRWLQDSNPAATATKPSPPTAILQPNLEALVPLEAGPDALAQWAQFAELQGIDRMCRLAISANSINQALLAGWTLEDIEEFLAARTATALPATLLSLLRDVRSRAGEVRLAEGRYFLVVEQDHTAAQMMNSPDLMGYVQERLGERVWLLKPGIDPEKITGLLRGAGLYPLRSRRTEDGAGESKVRWVSAMPREWDSMREVVEGLSRLAHRLGVSGPLRKKIEEATKLAATAASRHLTSMDAARELAAAMDQWADEHVEALLNQRRAAIAEGKKRKSGYSGPNPATQPGDREKLLRFAHAAELKVEIAYDVGAHGKPVARTVTPLSVDSHYLDAYCHQKRGERLFRLDRIESVRLLDEAAAPAGKSAPKGKP